MADSVLRGRSKEFAKQIVILCRTIRQEHRKSVLTNQLLRSGTLIGANIYEAQYAQGTKDFISKFENIYNAAFYDDYLRYGSCPGYGKTKEMMEESIIRCPKHIIFCDNESIGCISYTKLDLGEYEVACLCVIPEFQGKGIGTQAIQFLKTLLEDWKKLTLLTPKTKKENVRFYTEKCGFHIVSTEMDGNVELARFVAER